MNLTLRVWRQPNPDAPGRFVEYQAKDLNPNMSFLELLDVVNGIPHGPGSGKTACQLFMRVFKDGETITVEPFRAKAFPVVKDLVVDRGALDRIIASGGFVSVPTGSAPDGNAIPVPKPDAERAIDAAACIGCGACVAACPNASAMLFTGAKLSQLALLPQGQPERWLRARKMVAAMDLAAFGNCTNHGECEAACPKGITLDVIARMNRDFLKATLTGAEETKGGGGTG